MVEGAIAQDDAVQVSLEKAGLPHPSLPTHRDRSAYLDSESSNSRTSQTGSPNPRDKSPDNLPHLGQRHHSRFWREILPVQSSIPAIDSWHRSHSLLHRDTW